MNKAKGIIPKCICGVDRQAEWLKLMLFHKTPVLGCFIRNRSRDKLSDVHFIKV